MADLHDSTFLTTIYYVQSNKKPNYNTGARSWKRCKVKCFNFCLISPWSNSSNDLYRDQSKVVCHHVLCFLCVIFSFVLSL